MKTWIMGLATLALFSSLVACNKDKGSGSVISGPPTCAQYARDPHGNYIDPRTGQVVACTEPGMVPGGSVGAYCQPAPWEGCEGWSRCYPGNWYVPTIVNGVTMCVNTAYYWTLPGFAPYYQMYGSYPVSTCMGGACGGGCVNLGLGSNNSNLFFGMNVGYCF